MECNREPLEKENEDTSNIYFHQKQTLATQLSSKELVLEFYGFILFVYLVYTTHSL